MASKPDDPASAEPAASGAVAETQASNTAEIESEGEHEAVPDPTRPASSPTVKKKKSKKKPMKSASGMGGADGAADSAGKQMEEISKAVSGLSKDQIQELVKMNPSLAQELQAGSGGGDLTGAKIAEQLKRLKVDF